MRTREEQDKGCPSASERSVPGKGEKASEGGVPGKGDKHHKGMAQEGGGGSLRKGPRPRAPGQREFIIYIADT